MTASPSEPSTPTTPGSTQAGSTFGGASSTSSTDDESSGSDEEFMPSPSSRMTGNHTTNNYQTALTPPSAGKQPSSRQAINAATPVARPPAHKR